MLSKGSIWWSVIVLIFHIQEKAVFLSPRREKKSDELNICCYIASYHTGIKKSHIS